MATRSRYEFQTHKDLEGKDLPLLPAELRKNFWQLYKPILQIDPSKCKGLSSHNLKGLLAGYHALDIEWEGDPNAYRLVYRISNKPAPRRVRVFSFDRHDPAYDKAQIRAEKKCWPKADRRWQFFSCGDF